MSYRQLEVGQQPTPVAQTVSNTPKLPNVALQEITDKMSKGQRAGIEVWNTMVTTLINNNLMETD